MRFLLDTSTCIDLLRGIEDVVSQARDHAPGDCAVSTITCFELLSGAEKCKDPAREKQKIKRLLSVVAEVMFDRAAANEAAGIRRLLEKAGTPIGPYDLLLAGHALSLDLAMVTSNDGEFQRVRNLRVENWRVRRDGRG